MTWTIDAKKNGSVYKGKATPKADVTIILADETLVDLANGKVRGLASLSWTYIDSRRTAQRPEGVHDWQAKDSWKHDARHEAGCGP